MTGSRALGFWRSEQAFGGRPQSVGRLDEGWPQERAAIGRAPSLEVSLCVAV